MKRSHFIEEIDGSEGRGGQPRRSVSKTNALELLMQHSRGTGRGGGGMTTTAGGMGNGIDGPSVVLGFCEICPLKRTIYSQGGDIPNRMTMERVPEGGGLLRMLNLTEEQQKRLESRRLEQQQRQFAVNPFDNPFRGMVTGTNTTEGGIRGHCCSFCQKKCCSNCLTNCRECGEPFCSLCSVNGGGIGIENDASTCVDCHSTARGMGGGRGRERILNFFSSSTNCDGSTPSGSLSASVSASASISVSACISFGSTLHL